LTLAASCDENPPNVNSPRPVPAPSSYQAVRVAQGLSDPVDLTSPSGDTSRIFIVEKTGTIRILRNGALLQRPFLDVSTQVSGGSEQGLLGLAFHPQYASNGKFYVNFTDRSGDTRVFQYLVSSNPDSADSSRREILFVDQPYPNHNGGGLAFGLDGYLYIGLGDGGSGGDPQGRAQNLGTLLGKMLRVDVDGGVPYAIPADNPFVGVASARPEIWSYGLRNPWRYAFDRANGDLYMGDVGQNSWEEIDYEPVSAGGRNYGWNRMEGRHCYPSGNTCDTVGLTMPVAEYSHSAGCSVTGGKVYRGGAMPELQGTYFYGDYCTGVVRSLRIANERVVEELDWTSALRTQSGAAMAGLSAFGLDASGEIYLVLLGGEVYRISPKP